MESEVCIADIKNKSVISGSVTTAWRILRLRMEEQPQI